MRPMFRKALVAMLAVLAFAAVAANAAEALEAPHFKVAGEKLKEGQSKEITSKATKVYFEIANSLTICTAAVAPGGKIFGSSTGNAGTGELELEFTKCEGTGSYCSFSGSVKTKPLTLTLGGVEDAKFADEGSQLAALLKPKTGTEVMKLDSPSCGETKMVGSLAVLIDFVDKVGEEQPEAKTVELGMPYNYRGFTLVEGGASREIKYEGLEAKLEHVAVSGSFALELASGENWGVFLRK